jgi:2-polyprenyl-3-methyl-5-hydroxy-6-metoxy-1,4-benzoquinol methylase
MKNSADSINSGRARADAVRWFNAFDFGAFQARGRDLPDATYFNGSLFGTFDLLRQVDVRGSRCIDIGSGSGLVALGLKQLGAEYVAAADAIHHPAFDVARDITGHDIDFRLVGMEKLTSQEDWIHSFDVVVTSGLMYHLWSPFELVFACRKLLKRNGVLVIQSLCEIDDPRAALYLNSERNVNGDPTTYYVPGVNALRGMLKAACLNIVAERQLTRFPKFVAFMCRAVGDPSEVSGRAPNLLKMHDRLKNDVNYNFGGYNFGEIIESAPLSKVKVATQLTPSLTLDERTYDCTWPYNPKALLNPVGVKYR